VIGADVRIKWLAPYTGAQGVAITGYHILLKRKDGQMVFDASCDGLD
jgi:hypothetical protein